MLAHSLFIDRPPHRGSYCSSIERETDELSEVLPTPLPASLSYLGPVALTIKTYPRHSLGS